VAEFLGSDYLYIYLQLAFPCTHAGKLYLRAHTAK